MQKFTSIITLTFPSDLAFDEWFTVTKNYFLKDKKIVQFLKENGMTKWTMTKTDDIEPVKTVIVMEYENKKAFDNCQKIFSKFIPNTNVRDMLIKSNLVRGNVIFDQI